MAVMLWHEYFVYPLWCVLGREERIYLLLVPA